jgi:hypothetical protein
MPLLWVSLVFLAGLLAGDGLHLGFPFWLILSTVFLFLSLIDQKLPTKFHRWSGLRRVLPLSVGVLLLFFSLGGLRAWTTNYPIVKTDDLAWYNDKGE